MVTVKEIPCHCPLRALKRYDKPIQRIRDPQAYPRNLKTVYRLDYTPLYSKLVKEAAPREASNSKERTLKREYYNPYSTQDPLTAFMKSHVKPKSKALPKTYHTNYNDEFGLMNYRTKEEMSKSFDQTILKRNKRHHNPDTSLQLYNTATEYAEKFDLIGGSKTNEKRLFEFFRSQGKSLEKGKDGTNKGEVREKPRDLFHILNRRKSEVCKPTASVEKHTSYFRDYSQKKALKTKAENMDQVMLANLSYIKTILEKTKGDPIRNESREMLVRESTQKKDFKRPALERNRDEFKLFRAKTSLGAGPDQTFNVGGFKTRESPNRSTEYKVQYGAKVQHYCVCPEDVLIN